MTDERLDTLTDALAALETTMLTRSAEAAEETQRNQESCFGPNAAEDLAHQMRQYRQYD